jgi:lipopolysaccharide export LptBFGC system permease protein LptF
VVTGEEYNIENPFDSKWTSAFLLAVLLFIAFMFGGTNEAVGGMIVASFGGVLWYLGWYSASGGVVALALAVAVLGAVGKGSSR